MLNKIEYNESNDSGMFWPNFKIHLVHSVCSEKYAAKLNMGARQVINKICKISDSIRLLEEINESTVNLITTRLKSVNQYLMIQLSRYLQDHQSINALLYRAEVFEHSTLKDRIKNILSCDENELVSFCGNLATWHAKSKKLCYSAYFATPDKEYDELIKIADQKIYAIEIFLRRAFNNHLYLLPPPLFKVANLINCGGESNRYPKHFSYFHPEAEGIPYSEIKKTIIFKNIYLKTYQCISSKYSKHIIKMEGGFIYHDTTQIEKALLLWFRGHDMAHGIRLPETNLKLLHKYGKWFSMEVQEVIADCGGLIITLSSAWQSLFRLNKKLQCQIFMSELIRYLKKGINLYPDSGAAFIELVYLYKNGFVDINFDKAHIIYSCTSLINGFFSLMKRLVESVMKNNLTLIDDFYSQYGWETNSILFEKIKNTFNPASEVLDYLPNLNIDQE